MNPKRSIITKLWLYMTVLAIVTLLFSGLVLSSIFEDFYFNMRKNEMINEGQQLISLILGGANPMELLDVSKFINAHAVLVDRRGLIQVSSNLLEYNGMAIEGKELAKVLKGDIVVHKGYIPQFNSPMLTVALPIKSEIGVIGGLILYSPMSSIENTVWQIRRLILLAAAVAILISTGLSFILSKTVSKPLVQMKEVAQEMAKGEFKNKVDVDTADEIGTLAKTMNYLSDALNKNINALDQEKKQLQNVLLSMTDGVVTFDAKGQVIMANSQAINIMLENGGKSDEISFNILKPLVEQVKESGEYMIKEIKISGRVISVRMAPLIYEDAKLWGILAVLQDVTQERKMENMRREFLGDVSHELRTPLTYLQGYTEALLDDIVESREERDKYLRIILEETLRLRRLVDELLELSHIEAGHLNLKKDQVSVTSLVKRVAKKVSPILKSRNIDLILEVEDTPPIIADEDRIEQVLINLVDNAIRYSVDDSQIRVKARSFDDGIVVSIKDSGHGIPEDEIPFIWERFYKVDKARTRQKGGTGLGLAIVKKIIEVHGGKVWAKNSSEGGTTFFFFLPKGL
ncbi:MAG: ATP-binding protein [Tepidanaerobacteraceae bacterium]|nr:ATP-binding protein [Tepidanaerobacteraceae bacterium]